MKKSLLRFLFSGLLVVYTGFAIAQCTPDPSVTDPEGNGEMVPDTLYMHSGQTENITLTVIAPMTANVGSGTINLHHITVKSLNNKPSWLSYACNPGNCEFAAGVKNCVLVSGTVPGGLDDTIYIDVLVDVYANIMNSPVLVASNYNSGTPLVLIILPQGSSLAENEYTGFNVIAPQPNPFSNTVKIGCYTQTSQVVSLKIFDMMGKEVYSEKINTNSGENYFNFNGSNLNDGVYFYSVIDGQNRVITKKLVKSR